MAKQNYSFEKRQKEIAKKKKKEEKRLKKANVDDNKSSDVEPTVESDDTEVTTESIENTDNA